MKKLLLSAALLALIGSASAQTSPDAAFQAFASDYIDAWLAARPQTAVSLGLHQFDGKTADLSANAIAAELGRLQKAEAGLEQIDAGKLQPANAYDYRILKCAIQGDLFQVEDQKTYSHNPMTYADAVDVNVYIKRDYAPLAERAKAIIATEDAVPQVLAAARENLDAVLPRPFVATAIEQSTGTVDFLKSDLVAALQGLSDADLQKEFQAANEKAIAAYQDYAAWLKKERLPKADDGFPLGEQKFAKLVRETELVEESPAEILAWGRAQLKREQANFAAAAGIIDPTKKPIAVFQEIQRDHPTVDSLLPDTRKHLEEIYRFLSEHKIISLPSDVRVQVAETPQYNRATSFASMDTPGPFEKSTDAFYYVTPAEKSWSKDKQDEWLTAFNFYTTDVVSIHEAYPGHYVQFLHLNASHGTRLEKIFSSYAYVEGWAHYTEQMMLDEGFGADKDPLTAAKYRLAQSDEALLRLCRLCASIEMHCNGMSLADATKFFQENCYYEEKPAAQEATRGTFDPGYLNYSLGKREIFRLRDDYQKQEGAAYSLQKFNDAMTDHGMPAIPILRSLLIK